MWLDCTKNSNRSVQFAALSDILNQVTLAEKIKHKSRNTFYFSAAKWKVRSVQVTSWNVHILINHTVYKVTVIIVCLF